MHTMSDSLLSDLRQSTKPSAAVKKRVFERVRSRIAPAEAAMLASHAALSPAKEAGTAVWARILRDIRPQHALTLLEYIREFLSPAPGLQPRLYGQVALRLAPIRSVSGSYRALKWTAAVALFAVAVRVTPFLVLATPTVAESVVTFVPTRGEVSVSIGGLWQPVTGEITLEPGMMLRTHEGEASILFHDDGVVRLDANTTIALHDTAKRLGPPPPDVLPTLTLYTGRLWVQGLIPAHVRGLTVSTSYGHITVNEGSVSIAEDDVVDILVFDRRATVHDEGQDIALISGERTQLWEGNVPLVKKVADARYQDSWSRQNLSRDAVHRREIAQIQQERRAAMAGILPTSRLYSVKRVAEAMDVLLTFDGDARTQKRIAHANTRLNEAAALLSENRGTDAIAPLAEYRQMLLALADTSEDGTLTQFLLQQSLEQASADTAAALPDDSLYLLKQAVLEASVAVDGSVRSDDVKGVLIMDTLAALIQAVEAGALADVQKTWIDLQPHLALLEDESFVLRDDVRKEVLALLSRFAVTVQEHGEQMAALDPELVGELERYLPSEEVAAVPQMSEEQMQRVVQDIRDRIFTYHMTQPRLNQFVAELKALAGHPEQGPILRRLYLTLPDGPEQFPDRVRKEITQLRWERAGDVL